MKDAENRRKQACISLRHRLHTWLIGLLCALLLQARPAPAADAVPPHVALVQALYETYAWEAVVSRPRSRVLFQDLPACCAATSTNR